jgi:hypothetical protein
MHHGQQLQDMCRIRLLGQGELAALIGDRVVNAIIIGLREDCRYRDRTRICGEYRTPTGVEGAQHRGRS